MVDFIDSFNRGLSAAQQAEKNREEINSVFDALNAQLSKVSNGTVQIHVLEKSLPFFEILTTPKSNAKPYSILAAVNPLAENYRPLQISRWKMDPNGYPCLITTDDDELYCEDKAGLERGLQALISSPNAGEKIYTAMKQAVKPAPAIPKNSPPII